MSTFIHNSAWHSTQEMSRIYMFMSCFSTLHCPTYCPHSSVRVDDVNGIYLKVWKNPTRLQSTLMNDHVIPAFWRAELSFSKPRTLIKMKSSSGEETRNHMGIHLTRQTSFCKLTTKESKGNCFYWRVMPLPLESFSFLQSPLSRSRKKHEWQRLGVFQSRPERKFNFGDGVGIRGEDGKE